MIDGQVDDPLEDGGGLVRGPHAAPEHPLSPQDLQGEAAGGPALAGASPAARVSRRWASPLSPRRKASSPRTLW